VSENPYFSIFAETKNFPAPTQRASRKIKQNIHFMGAWSNLSEAEVA